MNEDDLALHQNSSGLRDQILSSAGHVLEERQVEQVRSVPSDV